MKAIALVAILLVLGVATEAACPKDSNGNPITSDFSIDGCNGCFCGSNGVVGCTMMFCAGGCVRDYWQDPCNFCQCQDGVGHCTQMICHTSFSWRFWFNTLMYNRTKELTVGILMKQVLHLQWIKLIAWKVFKMRLPSERHVFILYTEICISWRWEMSLVDVIIEN